MKRIAVFAYVLVIGTLCVSLATLMLSLAAARSQRQDREHVPVRRVSCYVPMDNSTDGRCAPHFVVIGTFKAGTTSLYTYLGHHPQVRLKHADTATDTDTATITRTTHPDVPVPAPQQQKPHLKNPKPNTHKADGPVRLKETNFFASADFNEPRALTRYMDKYFPKLYPQDNKITGEASPAYFHDPRVPQRLKQTFPQAKLIVLLREPVERAYSRLAHAARLQCTRTGHADVHTAGTATAATAAAEGGDEADAEAETESFASDTKGAAKSVHAPTSSRVVMMNRDESAPGYCRKEGVKQAFDWLAAVELQQMQHCLQLCQQWCPNATSSTDFAGRITSTAEATAQARFFAQSKNAWRELSDCFQQHVHKSQSLPTAGPTAGAGGAASTQFYRFMLRVRTLSHSLYIFQLWSWLQSFPPDQILVLRSEDFYSMPHQVMARVERHLGLQHIDWTAIVSHEYNVEIVDSRTKAAGFLKTTAGSTRRSPHPVGNSTRMLLETFYDPYNHLLAPYMQLGPLDTGTPWSYAIK